MTRLQHTTIQAAKDFAESRGGEMLSHYTKNQRTYFNFKCEEGHILNDKRWDGPNGTRWCKECGNKKFFKEDLERICKEKEIELLSPQFKNGYTSYKWKCHLGHIFTSSLSGIIRPETNHCKSCSKMKHDISSVKEECSKRGIICLEEVYKGHREPMRFLIDNKEEIFTLNNIQRSCITCSKIRATWNYKGLPKAYCKNCALKDMIDVESKMCDSCNLFRANKKYEDLCITCFMWKYPDHKITRRYRKKEMYIADMIKEKFSSYEMTFNKTVGGCSKRRPDILIDVLSHSIIIEIDEDQHKSYSCEEKRINELFTDLGDRNLILIRFNPDKYKNENNKTIKGIFSFDDENNIKIFGKKEAEYRFSTLMDTINTYIKPQEEYFKEIKLFYDV